jgi:hypothetical protein
MSTVNVKDTKPIVEAENEGDEKKKKAFKFEIKGIDKVLHGNFYFSNLFYYASNNVFGTWLWHSTES